MKIYYNREEFPQVQEYCFTNPHEALTHPVEYIASDSNKVIVSEDEVDQDDFSTFWDDLEDYISYILWTIRDRSSDYYIAYLEEFVQFDLFECLFLNEFKVEGVDWLQQP